MSVRTRCLLLVTSVFALSVLITWFLAGMRKQMEVGVSCATGGPYVIVAPCPEHSTSLVLVGMFGSVLVALAGTVPSVLLGAPNLVVPYWTFTSGGMAVNFFADGFAGEGVVWNWVLSGALMLLMALPGLYLMTPWQKLYRRERPPGAPLGREAWWPIYLVLAGAGVWFGSWSAYAWL